MYTVAPNIIKKYNNNCYNNYYNKLKKWNRYNDFRDEKWHYDYDLNGYWVKYSWNKDHKTDTWHWIDGNDNRSDPSFSYASFIDTSDTSDTSIPDTIHWIWDNEYHGWWIERWWKKMNQTDYTWVDDNIYVN